MRSIIDRNNCIQMKNVDAYRDTERYYLGKTDAAKEWNDDKGIAKNLFLHTKTYSDFLEEDSLILLGRTGTGKTAILRCIEEEVKNKIITNISYVVRIHVDDITTIISEYELIDNTEITKIAIKKCTEWIINIYIMKELIQNINCSNELQTVNRFLTNIGINRRSHNIVKKMKNIIKIMSNAPGKVGEVASLVKKISESIDELHSEEYCDAVEELHNFLSNNNVLVLIDSANEYNLNCNETVIIVKALISNCFNFYDNFSKWHIYLKLALPSELYTHILQTLPGKQRGNTVVIQWKYDNLVTFIAKRIFFYMQKSQYNYLFSFLSEFDLKQLDNRATAEELIFKFMPQMCPTSLNYDFKTIAYCIRHTLKKPRELLYIFNALIDKIIQNNNINYFLENAIEIKNVIHSTQELMIGSALSMYNESFPQIEEACSRVLSNNYYLFRGSEISTRLKEAAAHTHLNSEDVKKILLESGLIGIVSEHNEIKPHNTYLGNEKSIHVITARFEYQIKGFLTFSNNEYYVIHPMCYEHFTCYVDKNTLIYMDRASDEHDIIHTILKEV